MLRHKAAKPFRAYTPPRNRKAFYKKTIGAVYSFFYVLDFVCWNRFPGVAKKKILCTAETRQIFLTFPGVIAKLAPYVFY